MKIYGATLILLFSLCSYGQPEISIRAKSFVDGTKITFGDIADFKEFSTENQKFVSEIEISDAPSAGEVRTFTSFGLSEILRYNLADVSDIKIVIPQEITVRQKTFHIRQEDFEKNISAWIESSCAPCEIKISDVRMPDFKGVSGAATWEMVRTGPTPKGAFYVGIHVNDKTSRRFWVSGEARIYKTVPVTQKIVTTGLRIQKEDFNFETRDVTFTTDTVPTLTDLLGSEMARTTNAKEVIWKSLLKRRLVMQRGQPVNVVMRSDGWNVNVRGISQGAGYIGDLIRVLNPMTNKFLVGVVVDDATIEVK